MTNNPPRSRNESIKEASNFLRGTIAEGLGQQATGAIAEDDQQLTKFHGIYLQDDRDLRPERAKQRMEKAFIFMARLRIPGGIMTPTQWLKLDELAGERANHTLRLTTRQTMQFHGIIKRNLRPAIAAINAAMLDTIAACGDVNRNVLCTPNPYQSAIHAEAAALARAISDHLLPKTGAYHEIWIEGEKVAGGEAPEEHEPIYGSIYLPRKFKVAVAVPPQNDVDVFAHDLGFIAIVENGRIAGYNVTVGGGMGMTHGEPDTYPRTADVIGFCTNEQAVDVAEKVVLVQRDHGNRAVRKHARLKYTIDRHGLDWFTQALHARLGYSLAPARPFRFDRSGDKLGWLAGDNGNSHFALFIENGRIKGDLRRALAAIARVHTGRFILTPNQNLIIADITPDQAPSMHAVFEEHGLANPDGGLRRNAMACVALPTCGLALAESERYLPDLVAALEDVLTTNGLRDDEITIRMTGCPNGCARPYLAEVGLVGRAPGVYNLYLGGAFNGSRLNKLFRADIGSDAIVSVLTPLFAQYARGRTEGERFSDFVIRAGHVRATESGKTFHDA
jgi:sulfite reductase (NADPH) hemoprotein beta-component